MAKDKQEEEKYKIEGLRRIAKRKKTRLENFIRKIEYKNTHCSCDPYEYCYCGNGKDPYSY